MQSSPRTLGVVLFEGFELLDVFGPCEAYCIVDLGGAFRIVMVAAKAGPVASAQGPRTVAEFGFEDCPRLDLILVPGGIGTRREVYSRSLVSWLRARADQAEVVSPYAPAQPCSQPRACSTAVAQPPTSARSRGCKARARKLTGSSRRDGSRTASLRRRPESPPASTWRWRLSHD